MMMISLCSGTESSSNSGAVGAMVASPAGAAGL